LSHHPEKNAVIEDHHPMSMAENEKCVNCEITNQSIWLYPQKKKKQDLPMFPANITLFSPRENITIGSPPCARLRQASLPFTNLVQSFPPSPGHMIATFPVGC
jgi:hypothetical protein